jgi:hypothetical protein
MGFRGYIEISTSTTRAQEKVDRVTGGSGLPGFEDREHLPCINAIWWEVMRWNTIVPLGLPHAALEDNEYNGYFIPTGQGNKEQSLAMPYWPSPEHAARLPSVQGTSEVPPQEIPRDRPCAAPSRARSIRLWQTNVSWQNVCGPIWLAVDRAGNQHVRHRSQRQ